MSCTHTNSTVTSCKVCEQEFFNQILENRVKFLAKRNTKMKAKLKEVKAMLIKRVDPAKILEVMEGE